LQPTIAVDVLFACQSREKGTKNPVKVTAGTALEEDAQKIGKDTQAFPVATLEVTDKGKEPDTPNSTNPPSTGNTPRSDTNTPPLEVSTSGKTLTKKEQERLKKEEEKRKKEEEDKKKKDEKKKKEDDKKKTDKKVKN